MQKRSTPIAASALFLLGTVVTISLSGMMAWAGFEGLSYFATGAGYARFGGMHCPILISQAETGVVRADFVNSTGELMQPYYDIEISGRVASRQLEGQVTLPPHGTGEIRWNVDEGDIDLRPFIFVKLDVLPIGGYATREDTCGILVVDLGGISGSRALSSAIALGLLCLLGGLLLPSVGLTPSESVRFDAEASSNSRRAAQALGISSVCALFAGLMGWWLIAMLLVAVSLLLLVMRLPYALSSG